LGRLFDESSGLMDAFAKMWGQVVNFMKDESNVIGYEILNEPFGINPYYRFLDLINCNNKYLLPFYKRVAKEIRIYDNDTMIFFEPALVDFFGLGFKEAPEDLTLYGDK